MDFFENWITTLHTKYFRRESVNICHGIAARSRTLFSFITNDGSSRRIINKNSHPHDIEQMDIIYIILFFSLPSNITVEYIITIITKDIKLSKDRFSDRIPK